MLFYSSLCDSDLHQPPPPPVPILQFPTTRSSLTVSHTPQQFLGLPLRLLPKICTLIICFGTRRHPLHQLPCPRKPLHFCNFPSAIVFLLAHLKMMSSNTARIVFFDWAKYFSQHITVQMQLRFLSLFW